MKDEAKSAAAETAAGSTWRRAEPLHRYLAKFVDFLIVSPPP